MKGVNGPNEAGDRNSSNSPHSLRITRVPTKPVRREENGRITIPLWLQRNSAHHTDLDLTLSPAEAEVLYAELSRVLANYTGWGSTRGRLV